MKRKYLQVLSLFLTVSMLAGCGTKTQTMTFPNNENQEMEEMAETEEENADSFETASNKDDTDYVQQLRAKYGQSDPKYDYQEPMYNLPEDHTFVFENVCADAYWEGFFDTIKVFTDPELENWLNVDIEEDLDNHTIEVKPSSIFYCTSAEENCSIDNGTWGSRSKFYLVQYKDVTTNEAYEKPRVTVFTIARDLDTPTLEQSVSQVGDYQLTWNSIKGADYYEVYAYEEESDYVRLMCTTKETTCTEEDFTPYVEGFEEEDGEVSGQNMDLFPDNTFFVLAKTEDGKVSGMSNVCEVADIAYTIPHFIYVDMDEEEDKYSYEGTSAMVLPTHLNVEMLDGSKTKMLLDYENAKVEDMGSVLEIRPKFVNAKLDAPYLYLEGMDEASFKEDLENVIARQKELEKKTAKQSTDIDIPYVPSNDSDNTESGNTEETPDEVKPDDNKTTDDNEKTSDDNEKTSDDNEETPEDNEKISDDDKKTLGDEEKPDNEQASDEKEKPDDQETPDDEKKADNSEKNSDDEEKPDNQETAQDKPTRTQSDLEDTIYANSALSAHIALNMLESEEEISLEGFPESSDRDFLLDCVLEAYTQNPLIGIMESVAYDYKENCLNVKYVLDKEESAAKREAATKKAQEITDSIITDDMNDFEKEEAINTYLCENASYDETIYDYINKDGSISEDVLYKNADSFLPYGILVNNVGVCESYAESFLLLARNAGLDAVIETGNLDGIAHEWNRVKIDGQWYVMDVTNNDNEKLPNAYFNLSDAAADEILIPDKKAISSEVYGDYTAASGEKEYYFVKGKCAANQEEAVEMMGSLLEDERMATIRVNEELDESDVEKIVREIAENLSLTDGKYYYNRGVLSLIKE